MVLVLTQVVATFDKGHRPIWSNHEWELTESHIEALDFIDSLLPNTEWGYDDDGDYYDDEWEIEKRKGGEWYYYHNGEPFKRAKMILLK